MKKQDDINFYSYGMNSAMDIYIDYRNRAEEIEREYGSSARLEFECGMSIALAKMSQNSCDININNNYECCGSKIIPADNLRNNSYFDDIKDDFGTSKRFDKAGAYIKSIKK